LEESLSQDARIRPSDGELSIDQNISDAYVKFILRGFVFKLGMNMVHLNKNLRNWKIRCSKSIDLHSFLKQSEAVTTISSLVLTLSKMEKGTISFIFRQLINWEDEHPI
jgi:hypothetical protein